MAFGFTRQPGPSRNYVNESNPDFAIGMKLSRRQYDAYIEKLGKRTHLPGAEAIRETERLLEQVRANLVLRENELDRREAELALREAELQLEQQLFRRGRQNAGQRRYNAMLDAYVANERRKGRTVTKRDARSEPRFKQIMSDIKGTPNKRKNPNVAAANKIRRRAALEAVGGQAAFREYYDGLYGSLERGTIGSQVAARASNRSRGVLADGRSRTSSKRR